jgi:hypothetical protein
MFKFLTSLFRPKEKIIVVNAEPIIICKREPVYIDGDPGAVFVEILRGEIAGRLGDGKSTKGLKSSLNKLIDELAAECKIEKTASENNNIVYLDFHR